MLKLFILNCRVRSLCVWYLYVKSQWSTWAKLLRLYYNETADNKQFSSHDKMKWLVQMLELLWVVLTSPALCSAQQCYLSDLPGSWGSPKVGVCVGARWVCVRVRVGARWVWVCVGEGGCKICVRVCVCSDCWCRRCHCFLCTAVLSFGILSLVSAKLWCYRNVL